METITVQSRRGLKDIKWNPPTLMTRLTMKDGKVIPIEMAYTRVERRQRNKKRVSRKLSFKASQASATKCREIAKRKQQLQEAIDWHNAQGLEYAFKHHERIQKLKVELSRL